MSQPIRIFCRSLDDLPPDEQLAAQATDEHPVVLELPKTAEIKAARDGAVAALAARLPDYSVFSSGEFSITVKKVIFEADVLANAEVIVAAARQFRATARNLMTRLAEHLGVPLSAFANPMFRVTLSRAGRATYGRLEEGWGFGFHGYECAFRNTETGQAVEVILGYAGEFGVLNSFFFAKFLSTTPGLEPVWRLFNNDDHYLARALHVLHKHGFLTRIKANPESEQTRSGLVALGPDE